MTSTWQGDDYEPNARHHRTYDEWFLEAHRPEPSDVIVDAGCGTAEFSAVLAGLVPDGRVIGVEPDPSMLEEARARAERIPNLEIRQGSIQALDEVCELASADLVVSRAVLHWIPFAELPRCFQAIFEVLVPGGWMHTESGGVGNVRHAVELLDDLAAELGMHPATTNFPHAGTALELLEEAGFEVPPGGAGTVAQRRPFDRAAVEGFLRTQASLAYTSGADEQARSAFLDRALSRVDELRRHDGTFDQTFVRLHLLCRRPENGTPS